MAEERFMESFNLQEWTRIGAMNRAQCTSLWSAPAERSGDGALVWNEERWQIESGVALRLPPHSKTLSACRQHVESLDLQDRTRIGAMNHRKARRTPEQRAADVSSAEPSFFCRQDAGSTLRVMESRLTFQIERNGLCME